jgi:acetyl-CoA carboxylase biotin carboxyl carrier protein
MGDKKQKASPAPLGGEGVDLAEVERLLDFMAKHGLEEFEYERGGLRIRLKKPAAHASPRHGTMPEIFVANPGPAAEAPPAAAPAREAAAEAARSDDLHVVKSPIVGTFYEAPSPGAEPFVHIGDHVQSGQVLCIVEAMKLMNEIESDVAGEVMRIFVENGQPVEYGEPLFAIHPNRKK